MTSLIKYDAACRALADAKAVDEVKDIHDKAEAMRIYARQAKNSQLEADAWEIRKRAEDRLGALSSMLDKSGGGRNPQATLPIEGKSKSAVLREAGISTSAANRYEHFSALPAKEKEERIARGRAAIETGKSIADAIFRGEDKAARREAREQELARKLLSHPEETFGVAIEDFEWDHAPWSRETGMDRHPSNHYPTAADAHTPEEIVARTADRFKCLADDCVLYMWSTIPHAAIAHEVLELRGFKYVTQRVWGKLRKGNARGTGYWVTGEHEILLIAVRGNVVPPATAVFRSFFVAPVREHSEKPDEQYEHAEFHFPNLPKIELNARRGRVG